MELAKSVLSGDSVAYESRKLKAALLYPFPFLFTIMLPFL